MSKIPFSLFDPYVFTKTLENVSKVSSDSTASYEHSIVAIGSGLAVKKLKKNFAYRS